MKKTEEKTWETQQNYQQKINKTEWWGQSKALLEIKERIRESVSMEEKRANKKTLRSIIEATKTILQTGNRSRIFSKNTF